MVSGADPPTSPSVIIVGAGCSGISAAKTLHEAGIHDFIILEATSRIGGRIKKQEFAGHTIEVGANWLHGTGGSKSSPLFKMAKEIKLEMFLSDFSGVRSNTYRQEGGLFSKEKVYTTMEEAERVDKMGSKLSECWAYKPGLDDDISILKMQRRFYHVPINPLEMVIDYFYHDYEDSEPPRITSLKHTLPRCAKEDFGTDAHFVADPRGFEAVVHHIAKQFLSYKGEDITDPRIKLNQVVKKIYYSKSGVEVTTEEGCTYHAKAVVVSVSIGVLQSDLIAFEPAFPEWKKQAITEFSMGTFTKIFLQFPHRFWPTGPGTEFFLYAHERRGYYPIWQEPVGPVHFTGEHTNVPYLGYADGAYLAGIKTANDVIRVRIQPRYPSAIRLFLSTLVVGVVVFSGQSSPSVLGGARSWFEAVHASVFDLFGVYKTVDYKKIMERTQEESITLTVARKL
ncbi:hypothetical protein Droror1_Dr00021269 [Drosera rotundifolia]